MDWNKQSLVKLQQVQTYVRQNRGMYVGKGKWMVSFTGIFHFRDHRTHREIRLNGVMEVKIKDFADEAEIDAFCVDAAEEYIRDNYHESPVDFISKKAVAIKLMTDIQLKNLRLYGTSLGYKLLPENLEINKNGGSCVRNFLMANMVRVWSKYTRVDLERELLSLGVPEDQDWLDLETIIEWVQLNNQISLFAFNSLDCLVAKHIAPDRTKLTMVFKINNNHLYPVMQDEMKLRVSKTGKIDLAKEVFKVKNWNDAVLVELNEIIELFDGSPQDLVNPHPGIEAAKILYVDIDDLCSLVGPIVKQTSMMPNMKFRSVGSQLEMIEHPMTGQIIVSSKDYHKRVDVCSDLERQFKNLVEFRFANQSWPAIAKDVMQLKVGKWPLSVYSPNLLTIMSDYSLAPYIVQFPYSKSDALDIVSADYRRCYTSILLNNKEDYPIFGVGDDIKPFDSTMSMTAGEYYIDIEILAGKGYLKHPKGFYPLGNVKHWLSKGYITVQNITHCIQASQVIKADTFKETVQWILDSWPDDSKELINCWIGALGQSSMKSSKAALTDSWETALAMVYDDPSIQITDIHEYYLLRKQTVVKLGKGNIPIFRHIIGASYIMLDTLTDEVCSEDTQVVMYNTDCIKVINPNPLWKPAGANAKPGEIRMEDMPGGGFKIKGRKFEELADGKDIDSLFLEHNRKWDIIQGADFKAGSACITCGAGYGKTQMLTKMCVQDIKAGKKVMVLGFTNTAVDEPRVRIRKDIPEFDCAKTFDTFFADSESTEQHIEKAMQYDVFSLEEYSNIPKKWMSLLFQIKRRKPTMEFRFFGDANQTHPVESDGVWYNYADCDFFRELCGRQMVQLEYIEQDARYSMELKTLLDGFLVTGKLPSYWKPKEWNFNESSVNITSTRVGIIDKINKMYTVKLNDDMAWKDANGTEWWPGMPIIAYSNMVTVNGDRIYNSQHFTFVRKGVILKNGAEIEVPDAWFETKVFEYGYADTVYRFQGRTLNKKYNIFQAEIMDRNQMYVALSRATKLEDIGLLIPKGKVWEQAKPPAPGKLAKIYTLNDKFKEGEEEKFSQKWGIKKGIIYEIYDPQGNSYIGSSSGPLGKSAEDILEERIKGHHSKPTSAKMKAWLQHHDVKHKVIESFSFLHTKSLTDVEYYRISQLEPEKTMNTKGRVQIANDAVAPEIVPVDKRFKINHEEKNKRYSITYRINGKLSSHRFSYAEKMTQEEALKAAETKQDEIRKVYL